MLVQVDSSFASDDRARAEIGAAVRYLLKDASGRARDEIVQAIVELVRDVASGPLAPGMAPKQPAVSGITYKDYVIDAYRRDTDRWRATIRRSNGKKIRIVSPPAVRDEVTTVTDAITAEKAVEFAKRAIDAGEVI
ncbi:hypothetical protein [Bradyrhizobium genosp. P]|uniref:hypothetical protein n=1 Tax=Bradyrhizobium genosp. P TaxID=83641 RepID=UPI003CEE8E86